MPPKCEILTVQAWLELRGTLIPVPRYLIGLIASSDYKAERGLALPMADAVRGCGCPLQTTDLHCCSQ